MFSREQIRDVDRRAIEELGVPGVVLMENAGRGCAELLLRLGIHGPVTICCGKGNNGGDGFVIARHLDNVRIPVRVLLFADPSKLSGDAAVNYHILRLSEFPVEVISGSENLSDHFRNADWIVDALLGTGLSGQVRSPMDTIISAINQSGANIISVDIPSGLDCNSGEPLGCAIRAHHTATFVGPKLGFGKPSAQEWLGKVHVIGIGAPREYNVFGS